MNDTLRTIHSLRSIHGDFSNREISSEDLGTILNACVRAATASFRQSYSVVVVEDRAVMKEFLPYEGSKALIFCVDYNRLMDTGKHLNHSFSDNEKGIIAFITGSIDALLVAQTAAIAAKSLGIDSLFTNSIHYRQDIDRIYKQLGLPEKHCFPLVALILGYPSKEPDHLKGRLKKGVIHYNKYHNLSSEELDEIIEEYDELDNYSWLHQYEGTGKEQEFHHYLDWFYTVWLARSGKNFYYNTKKLGEFHEILQRAGFLEM